MGIFPDDDEENEDIDDKFADSVLDKATSGRSEYVDVDDVIDAYNWLILHERYEDADTVLDYGQSLHVGDCRLLLLRATALIDKSELGAAAHLLDYISGEAGDEPRYYVCRGWLAIRNGNDKAATEFFDAAINCSERDNWEVIVNEIGSNLVQFEKFDMAVKYYSMISSEAWERNPQPAFEFAYALGQVGQDDKAVTLYEQIVKIEPFNDNAWYNLGILYGKRGEAGKSVDAYVTCTDISPDYAEAYFNLGNTYMGLGKYIDAVDCYTDYLSYAASPFENSVYAYLGDCWGQMGNYELAGKLLAHAVKLMPDLDSAWYNLGRCYLEQSLNSEAVSALKNAIERNSSAADYFFALAQAYFNMNKLEETVEALENGLRQSPEDVLAWFEVVRLRFNFAESDMAGVCDFFKQKKEEFNSPKALQLVEAYVEFFVFGKKRTATTLLRDVAKTTPQVIKEASTEPDLSKLFEQKGILKVLNEFNIKL